MTVAGTWPALSRLAGICAGRLATGWQAARRHLVGRTDGIADWIRNDVDIERLLQLNRNQLIASIVGVLNPLLLASAIWAPGYATFLGIWTVTGWLLAGLQFRSWYRHRGKPRPRRCPPRLTEKVCLLALAGGLYWAVLPVVIMPMVDGFNVLVIAMVVCGMGVGGTVILALVPFASAAFFCITMFPTFTMIFLHHRDAGIEFWILALNFFLFFALIINRIYAGFVRNASHAFENSSLALKARAADRAKTQFIANMSHELRTPLNAINGYSEAMTLRLFGSLSSKRYENYAENILFSGQHLLRIIDAMIDISRIEAKQYRISVADRTAAELLNRALSLVAHQAAAAGVETRTTCADLSIRVDGTAVTQVLLNLLSNAIKFSHRGGTVTSSAVAQADGTLVFTVTDSGVGMTPGDIEVALSRFGKVHNALVSNPGGVGLGLPLSQELMILHGGSLAIRSAPGAGTRVEARFPPGTARPLAPDGAG